MISAKEITMPNYDLCECGKQKRSVAKACRECYLKPIKASGSKACSKCGVVKTESEYSKRRGGRMRSVCMTCNAEQARKWRASNPNKYRDQKANHDKTKVGRIAVRRRRLRKMFPEKCSRFHQELAIKAYETEKCEICECDLNGSGHVDHCHKTGEFRGILCTNCNNGLGRFKDSPELLSKAAKYLKGRE
jgi:hypothetical protein